MRAMNGFYQWDIILIIPRMEFTPFGQFIFQQTRHQSKTRYGAFLIPRRETVATIKKHAESNHLALYGFASDQSPNQEKTYFRSFFGTEVPVFTGAERIAKEHDIPVLMAKVRRVKGVLQNGNHRAFEEFKRS